MVETAQVYPEKNGEQEAFLDWSEQESPAPPEGGWSELKILMRNISGDTTPGTVSVDWVNQDLGELLSQGWRLFTAEVFRSTDTSFAMVFVLVRNSTPG